MLTAAGLVILLTTIPPQMTEINVKTSSVHPITIEPMLTPFDIAMFFKDIYNLRKNKSYVWYHSLVSMLVF